MISSSPRPAKEPVPASIVEAERATRDAFLEASKLYDQACRLEEASEAAEQLLREARDIACQLINDAPQFLEPYALKARIQHALQDYEGVRVTTERLVRLCGQFTTQDANDHRVQAYLLVGQVEIEQQNYTWAKQAFEDARAMAENASSFLLEYAYDSLAAVNREMGRSRDARILVKEGIRKLEERGVSEHVLLNGQLEMLKKLP